MPAYNLTQLKDISNPLKLVEYANTVVNGWLTSYVIFAIFIIMMIGLLRFGFDKAILASSFACFILSLFLVFAGLLQPPIMFFFLVLLAVSTMVTQFWGDQFQ